MGVGYRGPDTALRRSPGGLAFRARPISLLGLTTVSTSNWLFCGQAPEGARGGGGGWHTAGPPVEPCSWSQLGLALGKDTARSLACYERGKLPAIHVAGAGRSFSVSLGTEAGQAGTGQAPLLQVAGGHKGVGPTDPAQVDHCAVVGHLHRLANAGLATFQHLEFVHSVLHTEW